MHTHHLWTARRRRLGEETGLSSLVVVERDKVSVVSSSLCSRPLPLGKARAVRASSPFSSSVRQKRTNPPPLLRPRVSHEASVAPVRPSFSVDLSFPWPGSAVNELSPLTRER